MRAGLAANPDTPFEALEPYLDQVDLILCMTVFPGFGGQEFMGEVMDKVIAVRAAIDARELAVDLEVDGGIDERDGQAGRGGGGERLRRRQRRLRATTHPGRRSTPSGGGRPTACFGEGPWCRAPGAAR